MDNVQRAYGLTNCLVQEPEGSSPRSQQLATSPYPEPIESNPYPRQSPLKSLWFKQ
jgi:hypothetical protein